MISEDDNFAFLIQPLFELRAGDLLCIASTVTAKAEGRIRSLDGYSPNTRSRKLAGELSKDPRFVQAILNESEEILIDRPFLLVKTKFGHT